MSAPPVVRLAGPLIIAAAIPDVAVTLMPAALTRGGSIDGEAGLASDGEPSHKPDEDGFGRIVAPGNHPPLANLLLTLVQAMGVETDRFADATGTLTGLS